MDTNYIFCGATLELGRLNANNVRHILRVTSLVDAYIYIYICLLYQGMLNSKFQKSIIGYMDTTVSTLLVRD